MASNDGTDNTAKPEVKLDEDLLKALRDNNINLKGAEADLTSYIRASNHIEKLRDDGNLLFVDKLNPLQDKYERAETKFDATSSKIDDALHKHFAGDAPDTQAKREAASGKILEYFESRMDKIKENANKSGILENVSSTLRGAVENGKTATTFGKFTSVGLGAVGAVGILAGLKEAIAGTKELNEDGVEVTNRSWVKALGYTAAGAAAVVGGAFAAKNMQPGGRG